MSIANCNTEKLGKKLRELRGVMTQKEMAETFDVSIPTWTNWELGKREPNLDMLIRLRFYFGISLDELVGLEKPSNEDIVGYLRNRVAQIEHSNLTWIDEIENIYNLIGRYLKAFSGGKKVQKPIVKNSGKTK